MTQQSTARGSKIGISASSNVHNNKQTQVDAKGMHAVNIGGGLMLQFIKLEAILALQRRKLEEKAAALQPINSECWDYQGTNTKNNTPKKLSIMLAIN